MNYFELAIKKHRKLKGKLEIISKIHIRNKYDASIAYTPGVAEISKAINENEEAAKEMTIKNNTVAVVSNGTAVLGLGDIGALASLPVMEGKALLMKELAGVNAFPLVINEKNVDELVNIIKKVSLEFAAINLEDIKAPDCFHVEEKLQNIGIPVFHDDQHGTAMVVLAALINSLRIVKKSIDEIKVVVNGAGAAGIATARLLMEYGINNLYIFDSKGALSKNRKDLNPYKMKIAKEINLSLIHI